MKKYVSAKDQGLMTKGEVATHFGIFIPHINLLVTRGVIPGPDVFRRTKYYYRQEQLPELAIALRPYLDWLSKKRQVV